MRIHILEMSVGSFILVGILALLFLIFKVSGNQFMTNHDSYKVYAYFNNIGGLSKDAKVTLAGVKIGQVSKITLDRNNYMAVVEIEIEQSVDYLPYDSSAMILTSGLLGEKYIGISLGVDEMVLTEGDIIEDTQSAMVLEDLIGKFLINSKES